MKKSFLWFLVLLPSLLLFSCAHKPLETSQEMRLFVMNCGEADIKDISIFSPGVDKGKEKSLVVNCYLIKHPKGMLLWDTGLTDSLIEKPEGVIVREGNFHLKVKKTLQSQLEEIKVSPAAIDFVAFSHMHGDHSGNANLFLNSQIIMQEEEVDAAFGDHPEKYSFDPSTYSAIANNKFIKLKGDHDVFGDGRVVILRAPGHTPGHQALFLDLPQTGPVVISGDLFHFTKNREHKRIPSFNFDKEMSLISIEKIENFIKEKNAKLWIQHDKEQSLEIRHSPHYYQ